MKKVSCSGLNGLHKVSLCPAVTTPGLQDKQSKKKEEKKRKDTGNISALLVVCCDLSSFHFATWQCELMTPPPPFHFHNVGFS